MSAPAAPGPAQVTLGCRLNIVESEAMARLAQGMPDAVIVNTCAVTVDSARKSRQAVRRALRERPEARVIVSGCASEIDRASFEGLSDRVAVLPNAEKAAPARWAALRGEVIPEPALTAEKAHTRGFVAVQNGCDHRCTFCVIPFGRGGSRSLPVENAVAQVRALVETGHADVILTGVDLTSWAVGDLRLGDLVKAILRDVPDLARLRLSSLDCIEIDDALFAALAEEERLMPHLHLSLQAGDDLILKRMKRRHGRADAVRLCERLRAARPDIVFGADLIAGFPTETEAMFANTLALAGDCGLTHLHVFPYSPRPGTPAARMPAVQSAIVAERAARLRAEGERRLSAHLDRQIGRDLEILAERGGIGRARDFSPVKLAEAHAPGTFATVRIAGHDDQRLIAAEAR